MITVKIGKENLLIPNNLNEVSLETGIQCFEMITNSNNITTIEKISIISTLTGIEPDIFFNIADESIDKIWSQINKMFYKEQEFTIFKTFLLEKQLYGFVDLQNLSTLEYIDLDYQLSQATHQFENVEKVVSVLIRKVINKNNSLKNILNNILLMLFYKKLVPQVFNNYKIEEYSEECFKRAEFFNKKMDAKTALSFYIAYKNYRAEIANLFPPLFNKVDEIDEDQFDPEPVKPENRPFEEVWGWYHLLNEIAPNIIEREEWLKKPIKQFLTQLTYLKDKRITQYQRNKQNITN